MKLSNIEVGTKLWAYNQDCGYIEEYFVSKIVGHNKFANTFVYISTNSEENELIEINDTSYCSVRYTTDDLQTIEYVDSENFEQRTVELWFDKKSLCKKIIEQLNNDIQLAENEICKNRSIIKYIEKDLLIN